MPDTLKLLIAEDNPADATLLLHALRRAGISFEHCLADNEEDYVRYLDPGLDLILSDYAMPQFGALRALELLQASGWDIPFIIVSGTIGEDLAVEAMRQGAADYLLKDRLARLGIAVLRAVEKGRLRKERRRTEEALRESEERFREVVQNIDEVFWMTNLEKTRMLFVSAAYERIWGRTCESLYASPMTWLDAIHPDDRARVLEAARTQQIDGTYEEEYRVIRPDGSIRWISDQAFPVRNAEGTIYRVAGIAEDITVRRQERADLQLFRNLVDQSTDTFEVIDPATAKFLDVSARGPAEIGCTREEYLRMRVFDIDPLFPLDRWSQQVERLRRGEPVSGESCHIRKDGTTFPVEFSAKWVQLERPYIIASVRDITERRRSEARVREQAAMLDLARDAIIVRRFEDDVITFWNKGAERLYVWTSEEALGRRIDDLVFLEPERIADVNAELEKTGAWHGENRHLSKDGKKLTINSRATLVRDAQGRPQSVLVINTDVTEQKELEARFLRAQRMESIGTLASGVAHDLNNILSPIMMSVPLLRRDLPPDVREELVSTVEMSADRGAQIVKQVLAFGRGIEGERRPMQIASVIREIAKILHETFPKDISIDSAIPHELWPVIGDATQIHQVVLNLCVNARDAMPRGGRLELRASNVTLDEAYISMLPGATAGPNVLFEVKDSGDGIPPAIVDQIFDPFFTTKGIGKGTGLGLSTVMGIVKSHGGHISVNSTVGEGTMFQIHLPAVRDAGSVEKAEGAVRKFIRGHGEGVLVVDDEEHVRRSARIALETHGYKVFQAADGADALAVFAKNSEQIAVVLTDLMMPHLDGVALIHTLRKMKPSIPIVASTGLGRKRQIAELQEMNIQALLQKPYGAEMLLSTIHGALYATSSLPTKKP
ncbi:MAG TPA: PAS domain S-box protein [Chthoniobacter sp.]|jgi:PAS domain S-box-containing protein